MNLKKDILRVFSSNFMLMLSSITIGFLVPGILTIDSYSNLKTYTLYMSYISLFQFGFKEGIYIKYGGKEAEEVDKGILKLEHLVFILMQVGVTIIFLIISLYSKDIILLFMTVSILPINVKLFHQMYYQAIGKFKEYTVINNFYTFIYLMGNVLLVFLFKSKNYIYYCILTIFTDVIILIYLEAKFLVNFKDIKTYYNQSVFNNIKVGFFILIGNLSVTIFYGLDKWFVKFLYSSNEFAYYSFAVSMLSLINLLINSISIIFYNYLAKNNDVEKIKKSKIYLLIIGVIASSGYFIFAFIIKFMLNKYEPSLSVISILFSGFPYMIVINTLYINLYKVNKKEKKYLVAVVFMILVGALLNLLGVIISSKYQIIAVATILGFISWYIYSSYDFKEIGTNKKEIYYLGINLISFLVSANALSIYIGFLTYSLTVVITTNIIYGYEIKEIFKMFKGRLSCNKKTDKFTEKQAN